MLVAYTIVVVVLFVSFFQDPGSEFFDYPQWKITNTIGDRITSDLSTLDQLTKPGEKIDEVDASSYSLNVPDDISLFNYRFRNDIYCSNNITDHIQSILEKRGIKNLSLGASFDEKPWVSLEEFNSFLIKTGDKCVLVDSYSVYSNRGMETGKVYFLRPDKALFMGETLSDSFGFYRVSNFKTALSLIGDLLLSGLFVFILAYIISILYHKVVLYIIFGKEVKNNQK